MTDTKRRAGSHYRPRSEAISIRSARSAMEKLRSSDVTILPVETRDVAEGKERLTLERYEERTSRVMFVLAIAFLGVYSIPVLDAGMSSGWRTFCSGCSWFIWAAFAADLLTRISLSNNRLRYIAGHPVDVLAVALPALRPLRVLRVFTAGQALLCGTGRTSLTNTTKAIVMAATLLVFIGGVAVLDVERNASNATIDNAGDALWWSAGRLTSVTIGEAAPVTGPGKAIAIGLALVSVSVIGAFAAAVAAWFVGQSRQEATQKQDENAERLLRIEMQLKEVHRSLSTIDLDRRL